MTAGSRCPAGAGPGSWPSPARARRRGPPGGRSAAGRRRSPSGPAGRGSAGWLRRRAAGGGSSTGRGHARARTRHSSTMARNAVASGSGPAGDLRARGIEVGAHDEHLAVLLRHHHRRVGGEVAQPVIGHQPQLVVADERVVLDEHVGAAARVVREAGQGQLLGAGVAAGLLLGLEDQHAQPGPREVPGTDHGVVAGADHDHVGVRRQRGRHARNVGIYHNRLQGLKS